ncbi:hypothetical protein [Actinophytocola sp.]|uniref:glycosyltransferase family 9 protein n=1 Tax=Actinophytocola sp. TaxID=1872138 RepID=UPI002D7EC848|nr:hypothetical protein [Actinophytocola sp.]HET9139954.1 hypothetical protein [Actinophytocola sp.]
MDVHVALNGRATPDITRGCPWIAETHAIDLREFDDPGTARTAVARLPQRWDYILEDTTVLLPEDDLDDAFFSADERAVQRQLKAYCELTTTQLVATRGRGSTSPSLQLPEGLGYRPQSQVIMAVPPENRAFARRYAHEGPKVCILLGGSDNYYRYPDVSSWVKIIGAIRDAFPGVRFFLTGVRGSVRGQTSTAGYSGDAVQRLLDSGPDVADCYDIGLWNQLALMELCDVFLSPHTGFAFLAPCVGTPWLALSGGHWPEYFFNDVPFYSVLPDDPEFPYRGRLYPEGSTTKLPSMRPENLDRKIPEIVEGMRLLLDPAFSYPAAIDRYRENIARANINRDCMILPTDPSLAAF